MWRSLSILLLWVVSIGYSYAQKQAELTAKLSPEEILKQAWVDSVYASLTTEQRIGQLFMVAAYSNRDEAHKNAVAKLVEEQGVGGLIFFQGTPYKQAKLTNYFQSKAKVPLMISIDGEWGLGMRLDSTISFPRQLTLGALRDDKLIYEFGKEVARQCKRIGIHVNFAPVVDVNNNPNNPVINNRSFGEDKLNVALKGLAYMEGMQDGRIMACAKHFPGHGDTGSDSHLTLPVIPHSIDRLKELELYPFKILINKGVQSVMAAHIHVPALDSTPDRATSLSKRVVTDLLKKEMGFDGLVFSDALNMKGVSQFYQPGEVDLEAFLAGNDVLLFAEDVPKGVRLIKNALDIGIVDSSYLAESVKKILAAKYDVGLSNYQPIKLKGLTKDLNRPEALVLKKQLYEAAMILAANKNDLIPFTDLTEETFASIAIGATQKTRFQETLSLYASMEHFQIGYTSSPENYKTQIEQLKQYKVVFVSLHDMSKYASREYNISPAVRTFIQELSRETKVVITVFGSPYSIKFFDNNNWVLVAHDEDPLAQQAAAQALFGGAKVNGLMPVTASEKYKYASGLETNEPIRLKYGLPESVGMGSRSLEKVDSIALAAIEDEAMPGCQILVAKKGTVVYYKSFGHHTYDNKHPVENSDLYDLASVTKIAATTLALMQLHDKKTFQLQRKLSDYIEGLDTASIRNLIVRDVLIHSSGLQSWIPFYLSTIKDTVYSKLYKSKPGNGHDLKVANNLYMNNNYRDSIFFQIYNCHVSKRPEYKYSDLGFYLFKEIVESLVEKEFAPYLKETFYQPLGLTTMTFNPLDRFPLSRIVPTENDKVFRKQLVHGYVHDPGAAMLGGVSGHAGLFSNANDLAIIMQMLLNRGEYGGKRYLRSKTVAEFTKKQEDDCRRGLGFDKPDPDERTLDGPTATSASLRSFGHSGFTGICVWADPDEELIYIFLSNRVYPDAGNNKLGKNNIRTEIHQAIYDAILTNEQTNATSEKNQNTP